MSRLEGSPQKNRLFESQHLILTMEGISSLAFLEERKVVMMIRQKPLIVAALGDAHGCLEELEELLRQVESYGVDSIIQTGDLIDRGSDSAGCVRLIRTRGFLSRCGERKPIEMVLGNHEDRLLRTWRDEPLPGQENPPIPWEPWTYDSLTEEDFRWLNERPYVIRIKEGGLDVVAVHGGFTPDDDKPEEYDRNRSGLLCRTGFLDSAGRRLSPLQVSPRFWADEYRGEFGRCVFGHTSFPEVQFFKHAVALDGSKHGKLSAIVVEAGWEDRVFSVPIQEASSFA